MMIGPEGNRGETMTGRGWRDLNMGREGEISGVLGANGVKIVDLLFLGIQ